MATSKSKITASPDLAESQTLPSALVKQVLTSLPTASLPKRRAASLKKNILARIAGTKAAKQKIATAGADSGVVTTRAGEGEWRPLCEGVDVQPLFDDGHTLTWLARFQAGGRLPAHDHLGPEESFVLHGSCYLGDELLHQGDRQFAVDGSHHHELYSPAGCTLLIRTARHATPHYLSILAASRRA